MYSKVKVFQFSTCTGAHFSLYTDYRTSVSYPGPIQLTEPNQCGTASRIQITGPNQSGTSSHIQGLYIHRLPGQTSQEHHLVSRVYTDYRAKPVRNIISYPGSKYTDYRAKPMWYIISYPGPIGLPVQTNVEQHLVSRLYTEYRAGPV